MQTFKTSLQKKKEKSHLIFLSVICFVGIHMLLFALSNDIDENTVVSVENESLARRKIKHITEDGIYPLPERLVSLNTWKIGSTIPKKFFRDIPNVSAHNYQWILNPFRSCFLTNVGDVIRGEMEEIFLLMMIASASWEFERRKVVRETWASRSKYFDKKVRYLFFLGEGRASKEKLYKEYIDFGDVVQESFKEHYKNLTLKTQGQLKWATYFCPNARYVMHVDDDVFVDVKKTVEHLLTISNQRSLLCGKIFMPKVRREGKWATTIEEYGGNRYPKSCVGWCFIMTQSVANEIYYTSVNTILFHLEDVTFTGIIREKIRNLELRRLPIGEQLCRHMGWPKDKPTNEKLLRVWNELNQE